MTKESCGHRRAVIESGERLIAAVARGQPDVKALATRWAMEKAKCSERCETCSQRADVEVEP